MKSLHIAIVAPYSYQPFRSIRQICSLFERELKNLGHTVTVLSPPSVLGDMTKGSGLVHKILSGFERTFFSPMGLVSRLQKLRRAARRETD